MAAQPKTVKEYLAGVPADQRAALQKVRTVIRKNLDKGYKEGIQYGGISYFVPHKLYPAGYHCDPKQPLTFAGIAARKGYLSVGLMCLYGSPLHEAWFRKEWAKTGKKLDMGKCCIRFKRPEDAALDVIGQAIARVPVKEFIAYYESVIKTAGKRKKG